MTTPAAAITTTQKAVTSTTTAASRTPMRTLGQDDFLKLLTMQLSNQDPMNPQSNTDFIAQMAQFSALEQSKTMVGSLGALRGQQELAEAAGLVGRPVVLKDGVAGLVDSVTVDSAQTPWLSVGGLKYRVADVVEYLPPDPTAAVKPQGEAPVASAAATPASANPLASLDAAAQSALRIRSAFQSR